MQEDLYPKEAYKLPLAQVHSGYHCIRHYYNESKAPFGLSYEEKLKIKYLKVKLI